MLHEKHAHRDIFYGYWFTVNIEAQVCTVLEAGYEDAARRQLCNRQEKAVAMIGFRVSRNTLAKLRTPSPCTT